MKNKTLIIMLILGIFITTIGSFVTAFEFSNLEFVRLNQEKFTSDDLKPVSKTLPLNSKVKSLAIKNHPYDYHDSIAFSIDDSLGDNILIIYPKYAEEKLNLSLDNNNVLSFNEDVIQMNNSDVDISQPRAVINKFLEGLKENKIYYYSDASDNQMTIVLSEKWYNTLTND